RKPLYYCLSGTQLWYATRVPKGAPRGAIDRGALSDYLELGYIPAPATTWSGVRKVPPGHLVRFSAAGAELNRWFETPVPGPGRRAVRRSRVAGDGGSAAGDRRPGPDRGRGRRAVCRTRALSTRRPDPGVASRRERRELAAQAGAGATPRNVAPGCGHAQDHRPGARPRDDRDFQLRGARRPARDCRAHRPGIACRGSRRARGGAGVRPRGIAA